VIIKSKTISSKSGSRAIYNHLVNKVDENEYISLLSGSRQNIDNCVADAHNMNRKNSVIHFIISSDEEITRQQALKMSSMLGNEFNFLDDDIMLMAEHGKERHNGTSDGKHWHFLVRANNPETGKTLNLSNAYKRQELVARIFEIENNLNLVQGRHNKYVYHNIDEKYKELIAPLCEGDLPNSFAQDRTAQYAKREGRDLFSLKDEAKHIFTESSSWNEFKNKISERGWTIEQGTKKPDVLILNDENGKLIGSLSRVLGIKKDELNNIIETPDSIIASRVAGGTSSISAPTTVSQDCIRGPAEENIEKPQETDKATIPTKPHNKTKPGSGGASVNIEAEKISASDDMSKEQKDAINQINKKSVEDEQNLKDLEKRIKERNKMIDDLLVPKKENYNIWDNWNKYLNNEKEKSQNIIDAKHPTLKHVDDKKIRRFIYKNFSDELEQFKKEKQKLRDIRQHIKELDNALFFRGSRQEKAEKEQREQIEKMALMAMHLTHMIMHKLGLTKSKPKAFDYMTEQQKNEYRKQYAQNEYARIFVKARDISVAVNAIAERKRMQIDGKLMDWSERDEVQSAKEKIRKILRIEKLDINEFNPDEHHKYDEFIKNRDIDSLNELLTEKNIRISREESEKDVSNISDGIDINNQEIEKKIYRQKFKNKGQSFGI